jgi:gamma-glutamylcyclotransferase (GGCT)/AIG2-like uncharacterized protein YtfP
MTRSRSYFFYGTLLDADVRAAVMGAAAPAELAPATLAGWRRLQAPGTIFPMIVEAADDAVAGAIARVSPAAAARLAIYEGPEYKTRAVTVTLAAGGAQMAAVFVPVRSFAGAGRGWDLAAWQRRHKRQFLARMRAQSGPVHHRG